ncbi:pyridoxamine 5'-phosphate oxidase family protein [Streptomyces sp. SID13031]|uniref:pyridoxamine 5'-phosphate oxidase family protein n=1 Tax=Streptomyces sp. SID13031 TaxID=2706046 RepID=UPI0013C9D984|nr:pyridoxamine 5'-phosphate oxidase family protein [Streptomyces sp. SID13031]NEA33974.1 pyridoxamine 5'-phosphate oxidase family protein [Streptomyces sp. SID13031]
MIDRQRQAQRFDHAGLEILDPADCLRLMQTVPIGRLVFTEGALPAVRPVNFTVDGETVVFCTADGDMYRAADRGDVVAFETDSTGAERQAGWTVTVVGRLSHLTEAETAEVSLNLSANSWTPGRWPHCIRLSLESLRGRRVLAWQPPVHARTEDGGGQRDDG